MAKIIKTTGEEVTVKPEGFESNPKELSLKQMQDAVGGYIERVPGIVGQHMFCNENGIRLELPFNPKASELAGQDILGNVILCGLEEIS